MRTMEYEEGATVGAAAAVGAREVGKTEGRIQDEGGGAGGRGGMGRTAARQVICIFDTGHGSTGGCGCQGI